MKSALKAVVWAVIGALVTVGLVLDPLHLHPIDDWIRGMGGDPAGAHETGAEMAVLHTCPMHPQIIQEGPGSCPICGMDLVEMKSGDGAGEQVADATLWTCPMHPTINEPDPGSCPICGMDLVEKVVHRDHTESGHQRSQQGSAQAEVRIEPAVIQQMNVTTETVNRRDLRRSIRAVGHLDYDEDGMVTVATRYPGFVENVHVNYIGQPVRRGDPLFEIYSPELVQTQRELLSAIRYADNLSNAPADVHERAIELVAAARTRLGYWELSEDQILAIERDGEVHRTVTVLAPSNGLVMKRMHGLEGMAIQPGMEVIHIADLSTLWLEVEIFEDQLRFLRVGMPAEVQLTYFGDETIRGQVRFIEPEVDERSRAVKATLEVPNPGGRLRVGMFASVHFDPVTATDAVAVPSQAVLRTGERSLVVVALGGGRFAPREVRLGVLGEDDYVEILEGLSPGEEVVTSAQFLIDSESNLQAAISRMTSQPNHAGH